MAKTEEDVWVRPEDVTSPQSRLKGAPQVIHSTGEGGWAVAVIHFDDEDVLAFRWNGTERDPLGFPSVHQYPVWFIIPAFWEPTIRYIAEQYAVGTELQLNADSFSTDHLVDILTSRGYSVNLRK